MKRGLAARLNRVVAARLGQDGRVATRESRDGVVLSNVDEPLFDGAETTKRDLVDHLHVLHPQVLGALRDRPLSVLRAVRGQKRSMQKSVPRYTPAWVATTSAHMR